MGERGDANPGGDFDPNILARVKKNGAPASLIDRGAWKDSSGQAYPFIVVSPQWGTHSRAWSADALEDLLDYAISEYRGDPERVYFSGISMGAYGTWTAAKRFGSRIAAIAPLSGGNSGISDCDRVRHLGAWIFHGDRDRIVTYERGVQSYHQLRGCNPVHAPKLTTFKNGGHDSHVWKNTYNGEFADESDVAVIDRTHRGADGKSYSDLYRWMLTFRVEGGKASAPIAAPAAPATAPKAKQESKKSDSGRKKGAKKKETKKTSKKGSKKDSKKSPKPSAKKKSAQKKPTQKKLSNKRPQASVKPKPIVKTKVQPVSNFPKHGDFGKMRPVRTMHPMPTPTPSRKIERSGFPLRFDIGHRKIFGGFRIAYPRISRRFFD
jgi:hypothetical protein